MCGSILEDIPDLIDIKAVLEKFPVQYEESMNTVLVQEVIRYVHPAISWLET